MSKYATEKTFGGQRLSLGRIVLVKQPSGYIETAIVTRIDGIGEAKAESIGSPLYHFLTDQETDESYGFYDAKTEQCVEDMPAGCWCWPPRV